MALHCQECGFANTEGANYCQRCGAFLGAAEPTPGATTAAYRVGETGEIEEVQLDEVAADNGAALVIRAGGGRAGESFALDRERLTIGRRPDSDIFLDDVTVSRDHAVLVRRADEFFLDDCGSLNGTYVNRKRIESHRLGDGDELQIGKYKLAFLESPMTASEIRPSQGLAVDGAGDVAPPPRQKAVTIGAVCKALVQEFPDISISKIRYLEDQKLLAPRRTQGGYRLYTQSDIQRLRTILRLQRDEFLPLRVIRQELAGGRAERDVGAPVEGRTLRRASVSTKDPGALYSLEEVVEETGAEPTLVRELEDFGVIRGESRGGRAERRATSTRPSARSSAPCPSSPATGSAAATCGCSAARPTARPSCCRASSRRRCARAIPTGARRRSRRSRISRR